MQLNTFQKPSDGPCRVAQVASVFSNSRHYWQGCLLVAMCIGACAKRSYLSKCSVTCCPVKFKAQPAQVAPPVLLYDERSSSN